MNLEYLKQQYPQLFTTEELLECSELYSLIFVLQELGYNNYQYKLAKKFIIKYIEEIDDSSYGYDFINLNKLIDLLGLFNPEQRLKLCEFYINRIVQYDQSIEISDLHRTRLKCLKELLKKDFNIKYLSFFLFKVVLERPRYIITSIIISIIFLTIILLPAPIQEMEMFNLTLEEYANNNILNTFYNVIAMLLDLDNDFKIQPLNNFGSPIIFLGRIVYMLIIIGTIGQYINSKFQKFRDDF
ncbi:hypothetical protein [Sphingobacterium multivorum]|uniref:hypothetical protein n=1 Tax=Sphingobacterium multivorum TaxID=28454 RepID=UPI0028A9F74F|nr:hypothetical protein [Sphingobacterium multivorum]